jgi:hypothetical protein
LLDWFTELKETPTCIYRIIIKDITMEADEAMYRGGMKMALVVPLPSPGEPPHVKPSRNSLEPCPFGFLWRLHCI